MKENVRLTIEEYNRRYTEYRKELDKKERKKTLAKKTTNFVIISFLSLWWLIIISIALSIASQQRALDDMVAQAYYEATGEIYTTSVKRNGL